MSRPIREPEGGYDPSFFVSLATVEDRHFWFRARNHLISKLAGSICADLPGAHRVLEVGFGTGNVLRFLKQACRRGSVFGMELCAEGIRFAKSRSLDLLVQADLRRPPFRAGFDLIGLFDVLEHIPDDHETLRTIGRLLAPHGRLLITVPAHPILWSYFDEAAHHCRRYSPAGLEQTLTSSGYRVEYLSQFMASLFPLMWLVRKILSRNQRGRPAKDMQFAQEEFRLIPVVNTILSGILSLETKWLGRRRTLPFGTSIIAIAHKVES